MSRRVWIGFLAGLLTLCATGGSHAGLTVAIASPTVATGGSGSIEVDITNTGNSSVELNNYAIQLQITPTGGTLSQLAFSSPTTQQLGYLTDSSSVPSYVFLGNSADAVPPPFIGGPASTVCNNDTFNVTDSTADGGAVTIASGQTFLVAVLPLTTLTQLDPQAGDTFMVSLVPGSGDGSITTSGSTYFDVLDLDQNSSTYGQELSAVAYTSTSGMVSISSAAVPEPATIVSGLTAMLIGLVLSGARYQRSRALGTTWPRTCAGRSGLSE